MFVNNFDVNGEYIPSFPERPESVYSNVGKKGRHLVDDDDESEISRIIIEKYSDSDIEEDDAD